METEPDFAQALQDFLDTLNLRLKAIEQRLTNLELDAELSRQRDLALAQRPKK